jgi:hypothetical protein
MNTVIFLKNDLIDKTADEKNMKNLIVDINTRQRTGEWQRMSFGDRGVWIEKQCRTYNLPIEMEREINRQYQRI